MSPPHNATNGWTSRGAAADFKDFAKDGERGDKYGMSGGPTVVTQDLTEALGRLTVVKDKTGDVGRALKAVRQVLGMPSDEPPWADLDPLEQGARRSAFRNALEEMRRFLENKVREAAHQRAEPHLCCRPGGNAPRAAGRATLRVVQGVRGGRVRGDQQHGGLVACRAAVRGRRGPTPRFRRSRSTNTPHIAPPH